MKRILCIFCLICFLGLCGCGQVDTGQSQISAFEEECSTASSAVCSEETMIESIAENSYAPEESTVSEESVLEESIDSAEELVLEVKVEIYEENTQELLSVFELTDQKLCTEIFETFDKCFAEVVEKHPHDVAPDKDVKTDYRVVIYLNTYYDADKEDLAYYIDISYPFGYTNDIYRLMHHGGSPFGEYVARCGKPFIDIVDQYVKQYIPAE